MKPIKPLPPQPAGVPPKGKSGTPIPDHLLPLIQKPDRPQVFPAFPYQKKK